jgi:hypothetical protein
MPAPLTLAINPPIEPTAIAPISVGGMPVVSIPVEERMTVMPKRIYTVAVTFEVPESDIDSEAVAEHFVTEQLRGSLPELEILSSDSRDDTEEYDTLEVA